jgi:SNF2 family DNA or RNA helicase
VLHDLPPKIYAPRYVKMSAKQEAVYTSMEEDMVAQIEGGRLIATNPLTHLIRLLQFSSAYAILEPAADPEDPPLVTLAEPSCKIDALMDILEDMEGAPAVVFALHKQMIYLAQKRLDTAKISYGMITGDQTPLDREVAIRDFQAGKLQVMLCTIAAGSEGITLTRANTAIFLQRSYSRIQNNQAEARIHRIGSEQHDRVEIIDIIADGTIEIDQREALMLKEEISEEVVRDRDTLKKILGRLAPAEEMAS